MDKVLIDRIKKLLRQNPRGLYIAQISTRLKVGRESITKYLDVLEARGILESSLHGKARVFYSARSVPASALLDISSDLVFTLDSQQSFVFTNQKFLDFFDLINKEVIGRKIQDIQSISHFQPAFSTLANNMQARKEGVREATYRKGKQEWHLRIRWVPTVFEDCTRGTTVMIEDKTREYEYVRNLEFLARTSAELADMGDDENIYHYIAERIAELVPDSFVAINSIDTETDILKNEAVAGNPELVHGILSGLQISVPEETVFRMENTPEAVEFFSQGTLSEGGDRLYIQVFKMYPEDVCDQIQEELNLGKNYVMGCLCRGGLYGTVDIRLRKGAEIRDKQTIEAFIRQAGVALQRRHMREKLRKFEETDKYPGDTHNNSSEYEDIDIRY